MLFTTCMFFYAYSVKTYAEKLLLFAGYVHWYYICKTIL